MTYLLCALNVIRSEISILLSSLPGQHIEMDPTQNNFCHNLNFFHQVVDSILREKVEQYTLGIHSLEEIGFLIS